jgi:hypothetical protein
MEKNPHDRYTNPIEDQTIDYRADCGSEDPRTANEDVPAAWNKWKEQSEQRDLKYFIPDWDDLVDPRYDFKNERYSNSTGPDDRGSGGWENEVFAHQLYDTPSYDGILVSREVLQKSKKKRRALKELAGGNGGVHRYLRVPEDFPVMGDCGAFGYKNEKHPPYDVDDVLEYYSDHGFNYGISVDHLVAAAGDHEEERFRYRITLENALEFYNKHQSQGRAWTPMAAVQGWDINSYVEAAEECKTIGYDYLAIGGLVKRSTDEILEILRKIREAVGPEIDLHVLGVARFATIDDFVEIGITSMDSATYLRRAWTSRKDNLWTRDNLVFSAVRVPGAKRSLRKKARTEAKEETKQAIEREEVLEGISYSEEEKDDKIKTAVDQQIQQLLTDRLEIAEEMREQCFEALRAYDEGGPAAPSAVEIVNLLDKYQTYVGRECLRQHYGATLDARPWEKCDCVICQQNGIEVAIFSGNNRNRRRGFHNTRVFYDLLGDFLDRGRKMQIQRGIEEFWLEDLDDTADTEDERYPLFNLDQE